MERAVLTWQQLQQYDPKPNTRGTQARYLCPFCGDSKPRDDRHRSLSVDPKRAVYHCHRCGASGKIRDGNRPAHMRRRAPARWTPPPEPEPGETLQRARQWQYLPLRGTPGEAYLRKRGIPLAVARRAGVRYCPQFGGQGEAVVFPFRDRQGRLLAVQGRYIADGAVKVKTYGTVSRSVFVSDKGAWRAPVVAVCEAPIDALSLQVCGLPAMAIGGAGLRRFLLPVLGIGRTVLLAFDADRAGDSAAAEWQGELEPFGCRVRRLRPPGKDWNEVLQAQGVEWAREHIGAFTEQERGAPPMCPRCGRGMEWFKTLRDWVCPACYYFGGETDAEHVTAPPAGVGYGRCARCGGVLDCTPDGVLYCVECRFAQ